MEIHRCKLCFRNFSNGRAISYHMKSHFMNFSSSKKQDSDELQSEDELISVVLQDGESEIESSVHRRKRSRTPATSRACKSPEFGEITEELSSVSDTTSEEDGAHCLMMLSRDQWERESEKGFKKDGNKVRGKYKCETCNRLFKSYQALGGHRASYKKIKAAVEARSGRTVAATVVVGDQVKVHECPFCHRVFASGQALGGHKRSHFMGSIFKNAENLNIDLNLPALVVHDSCI